MLRRSLKTLTCSGFFTYTGRQPIRCLNTSRFAQFNNISAQRQYEQLFQSRTGLFGLPALADPTGFILLKENAIAKAEELTAEATSSHRRRKMVQIFDDLSDCLCKVADLAEFVRVGHPQVRYAHAAEDASLAISSLVEKLNTNRELYSALRSVIEKGDIVPTTEAEQHVGRLFLFDFEQCGIHLDEQRRQQVVALNDHILFVGGRFLQDSHQPRYILKSSMPENIQAFFSRDGSENLVVSGLQADCSNEVVREAAYRIYFRPDEHQLHLLDELLESRHRLARLCGFDTYAHRVLKGSIAGTPENVKKFLSYLSTELKPRSQRDYQEMLGMKKTRSRHVKKLEAWDVPYYTSQAKLNRFVLDPREYMAYLSLANCMEGLDMLFNALYGIKLEVVDSTPGELWHSSVVKVAVRDANISSPSPTMGVIYCDLFERPGKPHQDCHFTIQGGRRRSDGSYQTPKVVLMLNLPRGGEGSPPLLTPSLMDNLFHEMGHAMHSMLARTEYQHVTGTRCATDLAEVPSILMEYFASDPRVVSQFARHYRTGEPMPAEMAANLEASRVIFQASETQLQVFYAFVDHEYHSKYPLGASTTDVLREVQNRHFGVGYVENTAWQLRFGHLVGYGAKYYSYLMSKAVAATFWHRVFHTNPFSRSAGTRYREEVLAHGGALPPAQLIENFLGIEKLDIQQLAESLIRDIDHN
ncbi:mitochondrial intermediate peptidase-like [Tropilaelaps mercedesae]|uniref:Mitochondrial intermediate peptidase-like n=1 Tax=Tropilaelaps mercedesae TaxID=418985 RepID=A0A1V9XYN1_9ACAR|nr:mitochondrial intermediate peptidase-like [Tropilaelaps mercedesae]